VQQACSRLGLFAREGYTRYHAILGASAGCVAVHPSDMAVAMAALDASVVVTGRTGERSIRLTDLHRLPGDAPHRDTVLTHGELITAVDLPRLNADTGEIRVSRMLGVFSVGRVISPVTARSQFLGAMTMGIGMALHEHRVMDPRFGTIVNHDFGDYHIPTCADIEDLDAIWLEEPEAPPGALGARGLGEIGIVGAAAAIANAAYHATGVRARNLPLTLDTFLS
jgi:CO/xanthine dehydrogenase Mo-binding subunit